MRPGQRADGRGRRATAAATSRARSTASPRRPARRFSLLPPENATGNYVKVVQRVPVKIVLDAGPGSGASAAARHVGGADGLSLRSETIDCRRSTSASVNPWIVAIAVMFATFMEVLDTTVVNVSLPHIAGNLSATHRRVDVGADVVPRRQRDHPAADRMAGQHVRPQAAADDVGRPASPSRRFSAAWRRTSPLLVAVPAAAGRDRRRAAAAVAGGAARGVSAARARQGDGLLGPRHRRRADPRARCSAAG